MDRNALKALVFMLFVGGTAHAAAYVRVLTQTAPVRTGPGADYRTMHVAERGEVMTVKERGSRGYWFRVELDDGSSGWIFGEQVASFEVVDDPNQSGFSKAMSSVGHAVFGPSPVPYANVELAFSAGVLGGEGIFIFRPAWLVDPYIAFEGFLASSPGSSEALFMGGAGWTLRMLPGAVIGPYLHGSAGVVYRSPKADAFTLKSRTEIALNLGGGLEITLRKRITLRFDFREWVFFDTNQSQSAEEYTGGLAIFF
jgi:uncharacterized protein YraI